jgi:hypothetical protein
MSKDPRSELWRGAEWFLAERIMRSDAMELLLASARIKTMKGLNNECFSGTNIPNYDAMVRTVTMDIHAIDIAYFGMLFKHYPKYIGYLNAECYSILLDMSKMARTAATGKYAIYRGLPYFMFYGTDTITICTMMQIADVFCRGKPPRDKWWKGKAISCLVRDFTDRFGMNHGSNNVDPKLKLLGRFSVCQIPREQLDTLTFDEKTFIDEVDNDPRFKTVIIEAPIYTNSPTPDLMRMLDTDGKFIRGLYKQIDGFITNPTMTFEANPDRNLNEAEDKRIREQYRDQFATLKALYAAYKSRG